MGFWEDRWIPTLSGNKLNDVNGDVNLKVSYVISNGSSDMSKLVGLVSQEQLNAILAIPLRSGRDVVSLKPSCAAPRVNNFIWRACIEALATNEALVKTRFEDWCLEGLVSNKGFSPVSGYVVNKGVGNAQVDDSWVAPGTDLLKCNVDGTFHSGFVVGGVGIICRNALGEVLDGCAEKLLTCSSLLIEAWALKMALLLACLKGWERVVFESDCAVLVDAVASLKGAKVSGQSPILLDILELLSSNEGFYVVFVRRQGHQAADWLAKKALNEWLRRIGFLTLHPRLPLF
ncbi:Polynucleotidyl transferase, Ribonuclease H fold [Senna tora]|uniref:Polynucleotidyl transferase, Ribonuclease H fold n=1 Tax=Senna tora TaxID=362788 RepID=A0A834XBI0_9FABA|nr:Polynucleotidyl transferase, Ribonuclease H fold [Senna tora]